MSSIRHPLPYNWQRKAWPPSQPSFPEGTGPKRPSGARAPHKAPSDRPLAFLPVVFLFSSATGRETPSRVYRPHVKATTAQTAHLWSRQLGLRGGPNPSRFTVVAKAAGKIPFIMQALTHRCTVGTVEDDSACTTPQAKLGNSGNSMKNTETQLAGSNASGRTTFHALARSERSSLCRRTCGCPEAAAGA